MKISIGQFIPGNSWIYKVDARAKLLALIIIITAVFMAPTLPIMLGGFGLVVIGILTARLPIMRMVKAIMPLMFILTITFIFQIFYNKEGKLLMEPVQMTLTVYNLLLIIGVLFFWAFTKRFIKFRFMYFLLMLAAIFYIQYEFVNSGKILTTYIVEVYEGGLTTAAYVMLRLFIVVILSTTLTLTTKPLELNSAIESLMSPLKVIKFPVSEFAMMISIALRFIPTLFDETQKIMKAQASRGVDYTEASLRKKITQIIALLIPMFIISFKRADDLANAMEARQYVPGRHRTKLNVLYWKTSDTLVILFSLALVAASIFLKVTL